MTKTLKEKIMDALTNKDPVGFKNAVSEALAIKKETKIEQMKMVEASRLFNGGVK